jgi:ABC-2 family transporter protein
MIFMQTKAMFIDAYRELNAKKLFWLTIGLNLFAVLIFASLGINERGFSVLFWTFEGQFNTSLMSKETFYKFEFITWGVPYWLSWGASILALISTAGIIPDLVSGGTIEPILSKPIGRTRLFLTKYLTGLLFVFSQILVFSLGCFLVLGIRAGSWEFGLFLAIPIVLAFFSYLFAFCVLVGLITRSTIAALLLTILFWMFVFVVNVGETITIAQRERYAIAVEDAPSKLEAQERFAQKRIDNMRLEGRPIPGEGDEPLPEGVADSLQAINPTLGTAREQLETNKSAYSTWSAWADRVSTLKLVLPKTQETISLLERNLLAEDELDGFIGMMQNMDEENNQSNGDSRINERITDVYASRTPLWILGTSFIFEGVILFFATLIFRRRDF